MAYSQGVKMAEQRVARMDSTFTLLKSETGKIHSRMDFFGSNKKSKCDPRYGWKQGPGGKCVRVAPKDDPEKNYGTDTFLLPSDRDAVEAIGGSSGLDSYQKSAGASRGNAVEYYKDVGRLMSQEQQGGNFNEEISELNRFAIAREKGDKSVKNAYGTNTFVSSTEKKWIDEMGGPETVKDLPKDKSVAYLKDVYATRSSRTPQKDLDNVNKHYFK